VFDLTAEVDAALAGRREALEGGVRPLSMEAREIDWRRVEEWRFAGRGPGRVEAGFDTLALGLEIDAAVESVWRGTLSWSPSALRGAPARLCFEVEGGGWRRPALAVGRSLDWLLTRELRSFELHFEPIEGGGDRPAEMRLGGIELK